MLRDESTEPMVQHTTSATLPGAARAAQTVQAQADAQETMTTLADQLLVLFDEIPCAGLIRQQRRAMGQHVQTYFRIADGVWEALATDHLHELTNNPSYTIATDALEQRLVQIHEECQRATLNPKARGGWLWRRRTRHYSRALLEWKRCIDTGDMNTLPDPTACGQVLYRAHGRVGLARLNAFSYVLVITLPVLGILASLLLAAFSGAMNVLMPGDLPRSLAPTILAALSALFMLWFSVTGPSSLPLLAGYALTRRQNILFTRSLRASLSVRTSPGPWGILLRIWLITLGTLCLLALLGLLALTVYAGQTFFANPPGSAQDISGYMNSFIQANLLQGFQADPFVFTLILPASGLLLITLFFLPFTLSIQARLARALMGQPAHSPEARRYALQPALEVLTFHSIILLFLGLLANSIANLGTASLLPDGWPLVNQRLLVYLGALIVPYLLLIDLPFREGMTRWRGTRLHELALRRSEIAQRLSRSQPQATDQTDLRTLQDYLTWQYYRTQESDVRETTTAPFSMQRRLLGLVLAIIGGIALDQINQLLHTLL